MQNTSMNSWRQEAKVYCDKETLILAQRVVHKKKPQQQQTVRSGNRENKYCCEHSAFSHIQHPWWHKTTTGEQG